ncbi:MAG: ABC transporter permease [Thermoguttaceae bacterium]
MKFFLLIVKNVARNPLRSLLTLLGSMVLVMVVTLVWSILYLLDMVTEQKNENFKAIVTDRWSIPSRLPFSYEAILAEGAAQNPGDSRPIDYMSWQFYVGTLDPARLGREYFVFAIALDPAKVTSMMEGLDSLTGEEKTELERLAAQLQENPRGVIAGRNVLRLTRKRVGERFKAFGLSNFKGLDFEFEILGVLPAGRYDNVSIMNRQYFDNALEGYARANRGRSHPLADRRLNLVWLKVSDTEAFTRVARQIEFSPRLRTPPVKCETASSSFASWLEAFRDLIWGMRWLLAPACLVSLSLVIANAISISVRERRAEIAVLKVLGYRPWQVLVLILGESLLLGTAAGLASAALTYAVVNWLVGGIPFAIGFFDRFFVPAEALWWGTAVGALTSLAGSLLPAWAARNVKVADVFAKVA